MSNVWNQLSFEVVMWTTEPAKRAWTRVAIIAGYQLVLFTVIGTIFSMWG